MHAYYHNLWYRQDANSAIYYVCVSYDFCVLLSFPKHCVALNFGYGISIVFLVSHESTCHSASRPVDNPRQQSIAQEISKQLYARVLGYDGRASYYDVAKNGHVKVGESISRAAVVESHRLTNKKDNDSSYGYSVRKRMFVNGVEPRGLNFILGSM